MTDPSPRSEPTGNPFWRFSLALYGRPGVPPACLRLQDEAGVDVNVLLFAMWLGRQGRSLTAADLRSVLATVDPWRLNVVVPLRTARRALKDGGSSFAEAGSELLRSRVKAAELESERLQQEVLFTVHAQAGDASEEPGAAIRQNLAAYGDALGRPLPVEPLGVILAALEQVPG
jgi:uncharacterized protein (TIGR02444 family)